MNYAHGESGRGLDPAGIFRRTEASVVRVYTPTETGTGFIYDSSGLAVTNAHVVGNNNYVGVDFGHRKCGAILLGKNNIVDLAVIKIVSDTYEYPPIPLGDSNYTHHGDGVVVVGYPLGEILQGSSTITSGIVSAKGRSGSVSYIQTNAAINPGNSGGPMLNNHGEVIGIVSSKIHQHGEDAIEGIGLAIDVNELTSRVWRLEHGISVKESFRNWLYEYSFDIPQGWHPRSTESWDRVEFATDDGGGYFRVNAIDLERNKIRGHRIKGDSRGLKRFSEWVRDETTASFGSPNDYNLDHFGPQGDYYRYTIEVTDYESSTHDVTVCELSTNFKERQSGFYLTTWVRDDLLFKHDSDRHSMIDSFKC